MRSGRVLVVLFFFATSSTALAATKAIKFGKLVDGTGRVFTNAVVIVEDDRVQSVASGNASIPSGAEVLDLSRYTGIPGLIDAHTHITYYWDQEPGTLPWAQLGSRLPAESMFLAQENARKALEVGVTTVRNLHAAEYTDVAMRDLINMGAMVGPRMFVSGYGLHIASRASRAAAPIPSKGQANGIDEVARAVREQIAAGADWVKMFGSTGSAQDVSGN